MAKPTSCKMKDCEGVGSGKYNTLVKGLCDKHYQRLKKYGDPDICKTYQGNCKHPLYEVWRNMKQRCCNPNRSDYHRYGGRGIKVCESWENSFESFVKDMGKRPKGYLLDRIDNNGNYEPSNCRWVTVTESSRNKSTNRVITFKGKTQTLIGWAEELNVNKHLIQKRLSYGWDLQRVMSEPVNKCGEGHNRRYET